MKEFVFYIDEKQVDFMFSPIRKKSQMIELLMKTVKVMLIGNTLDPIDSKGKIVLRISRMNRLFYFSGNKYFSICFPFHVVADDGKLLFSSNYIDEIDHEIISHVMSVVSSSGVLSDGCVYRFFESVSIIDDDKLGFWNLLRELLLLEDGYIRYDYDEVRNSGAAHPINHLDIFYSSSSTFKIGLHKKIENNYLVDLLDLKTECKFLDI